MGGETGATGGVGGNVTGGIVCAAVKEADGAENTICVTGAIACAGLLADTTGAAARGTTDPDAVAVDAEVALIVLAAVVVLGEVLPA